MVVQIRESAHTKPYSLADAQKWWTIQKRSDWQSFIRTKFDVLVDSWIVDRTERGFSLFIEAKKSPEQTAYKQMAAYLRSLLSDQEKFVWRYIGSTDVQIIPLKETVTELRKRATVTPPVEILYENQELIDSLLGNQGKLVLEKVINLIQDLTRRENWPLTKIVVHHVKDLEVEDWEYALVVFYFNSDLDTADKYLRDFYKRVDILTEAFSDEEQDILEGMLYFDVGTTVSEA